MENEKLTINIGAVDLGKIDLLVSNGFYSSRSDFIRTATRNIIEKYSNEIDNIRSSSNLGINLIDNNLKKFDDDLKELDNNLKNLNESILSESNFAGTGVIKINKNKLEKLVQKGKKLKVKMVGMLIIDKNVSVELAKNSLESIKVFGIIRASDEVKKILSELTETPHI